MIFLYPLTRNPIWCTNPISLILLLFTLIASCVPQQKKSDETINQDDQLFQLILSLDTLRTVQRIAIFDSVVYELPKDNSTSYFYLKSDRNYSANNLDSAAYYLNKMQPDLESEWDILKNYLLLEIETDTSSVVSSLVVSKILNLTNKAEQENSKFTYRLYDVLAKSYFINKNTSKAKEYASLWYENHPYKTSAKVRQRYFDLLFMFAQRDKDAHAMKDALENSTQLALSLNDSSAIIRALEHEAQWNAANGNYNEAIKTAKMSFNYYQDKDRLEAFYWNNIAVFYFYDNQLDSAVHYYNEAIIYAKQYNPNANLTSVYGGLRRVYEAKKDYKNAYTALDSLHAIERRNAQSIQAEKIEEIHTQYQTEKKDNEIKGLKKDNELIQKNNLLLRWIFGFVIVLMLFIVFFLYGNYRRKLLKAQNEKLLLENKKLILEQKINQMQLNPHFIHNAIANMQGLVSTGNKTDANNYLVALSRYIRNTLELNRQEFITLSEEIASITNYLQLQQMRYEDRFDFKIDADDLDTDMYLIPPMLLQPFIENSIEHGFRKINYKGFLSISFTKNKEQLIIQINDNGAGAEYAQQTNKKSLSTIIIKERLELLFNLNGENNALLEAHPYKTDDQTGYVVNICIPLIKD